jgi:hypothetical protein
VTKPAASWPNSTPRPQEKQIGMYLALKQPDMEPHITTSWIDRDIRDFLAGRNEGAGLLHALYDRVLDEPVPERLRAALKR